MSVLIIIHPSSHFLERQSGLSKLDNETFATGSLETGLRQALHFPDRHFAISSALSPHDRAFLADILTQLNVKHSFFDDSETLNKAMNASRAVKPSKPPSARPAPENLPELCL